jgi:hypothetical protein
MMDVLPLYVVTVMMMLTQSSTVDDAVLVSFIMTTWLVDVLFLNVVDGHSQYREMPWIYGFFFLHVLCYALTLIKNIIYVFMLKDEMGAQNKKRKKIWISPKAIAKEIIYKP